MSNPTVILLVRFKSRLSFEQVMKIAKERIPQFRALEGLEQKYYLQDPESGEIAGLYLWRSADDLAVYRESALRASIAEAYQVEGEPRVEVYRVVETLRSEAS